MKSSTLLQRSPDVLETTVNDEPLLLHSTRWQYLHFTGSGSAIWQLLGAPITLERLLSSLQSRFEVDEATCRRETETLLTKLVNENFIIAT